MFKFIKPPVLKSGVRNLLFAIMFVVVTALLAKIQHGYFPVQSGLIKDWALEAEELIEHVVRILDYILAFLLLILILVFSVKKLRGPK